MKRIISLAAALALIIAAIPAAAATRIKVVPSKTYVSRVVSCPDFTKLVTNTTIDIEYTVGPKSVKLYAPDNLIDYMQVTSSGSSLTVSWKSGVNLNINGNYTAKMIVSAPAVNDFLTNSTGDITIKSPLQGNSADYSFVTNSTGDIYIQSVKTSGIQIKLVSNSTGDITAGRLQGSNVHLTANSTGDVKASAVIGSQYAVLHTNSTGDVIVGNVMTEKAMIASSSTGDVKIENLSADDARINSRSTGDVRVSDMSVETLTVEASSTGDIKLAGKCSSANMTAGSTSEIEARNLKALDLTVSASSTAEVECYAVRSINASCSSSSAEIRCYSKPGMATLSGSYTQNIHIGR